MWGKTHHESIPGAARKIAPLTCAMPQAMIVKRFQRKRRDGVRATDVVRGRRRLFLAGRGRLVDRQIG